MKNKNHRPLLYASLMVLITTIFTLPLFAQTWLAQGQTWQYQIIGGWNPNEIGLHTMTVEGDTLIQGKLCKKVVHYPLIADPIVRFAYEEKGQVFVYTGFSANFIKIYDFNLEIGDTVQLNSNDMYIILETGVVTIENSIRKFQYIKYYESSFSLSSTKLLLEGIGLVDNPMQSGLLDCSYFFLQDSFCDEIIDGWSIFFRCFQDDGFIYSPFDNCTLSDAFLPNNEPTQLVISPNPANRSFLLNMEGHLGDVKLELFNTTGQMLYRQTTVDLTNPLEVSVSHLPDGLYFVRLTNEQGSISKSVVVSH